MLTDTFVPGLGEAAFESFAGFSTVCICLISGPALFLCGEGDPPRCSIPCTMNL